jgi:hypothetical protein
MEQPDEAICLNFMIGQMGPGVIQMQKAALFWIWIVNLGEFLLQIVQNDVHEEKPINRSPGGNMTIPIAVKHTQNMTFFAPTSLGSLSIYVFPLRNVKVQWCVVRLTIPSP